MTPGCGSFLMLEKGGLSGVARVRLADLNGPKWTILVHFGLVNAKIRFGIRSC